MKTKAEIGVMLEEAGRILPQYPEGHLDFSPMILILHFWPPELRECFSVWLLFCFALILFSVPFKPLSLWLLH